MFLAADPVSIAYKISHFSLQLGLVTKLKAVHVVSRRNRLNLTETGTLTTLG
jgi:hypothetical protein